MKLSYRLSRTAIESSADAEALLLITISAPVDTMKRRPVNLGVALDRSGSMAGEPLAIAKAALEQFVSQLLPDDRLTVVAFDDTAVPIVLGEKSKRQGGTSIRDRGDRSRRHDESFCGLAFRIGTRRSRSRVRNV